MIFFGHVTPAGVLELDHLSFTATSSKAASPTARADRHRQEEKRPARSSSAYRWAAVYGWVTRNATLENSLLYFFELAM